MSTIEDNPVEGSPLLAFFPRVWNAVNGPDTYLPLYLSLTLFMSGYLYCLVVGKRFNKFAAMHHIHNFGVIILGFTGLYFDDNSVLRERTTGLFTCGYFIVDLVENATNLDLPYTLHAIACLIVAPINFTDPIFLKLRMESKATMMELSSPFLHLSQYTRKPLHFVMFFLVFTGCRIIWLPVLMRQLYLNGLPLSDPKQMFIVAFYGLNLFWYSKIVRILIQGREPTKSKTL
mmetsp:Transcript_14837/g.19419  ORF Transcript_14837/g.19419 Transcript_14837/m.19419 type:complete len:232 (+) Transcript_14837:101-796(+)